MCSAHMFFPSSSNSKWIYECKDSVPIWHSCLLARGKKKNWLFQREDPFFSKVRASSLLLYVGSKAGIELYSSLRAKIISKTTLKHQNNSEQILNAMVTYHRRLPNAIFLSVNGSS